MSETRDENFEDIAAARASLPLAIARVAKLLWRPEMLRWRGLLLAAIVLTLIAKLLSVYSPVWLGHGIDRGLARDAGAVDAFFVALALYASGRFFSLALPFVRDGFFAHVTQDANRLISVDAFRHSAKLSLNFHMTRRAGALSRIIERGAAATEYLLRFLGFNIVPTLIELTLAAIVLGTAFGVAYAVIAVVTVVVYVVFTVLVTEWRTRQRRAMNEADTELRARAMDSMNNFETVKTFAAEDREAARYDKAQLVYKREFVRSWQSLSVLNTGQEFIMTIGLAGMIGLAGYRAATGSGSIGDVTAVMLMLLNIYRPMNILGWAWREIKQGVVDLEKLFGLLDIEPDVADAPGAAALRVGGGALRFEGVTFIHGGRDSGVRDIELDIKPGSFVGVVGPSGAGKSTLLRLITRLYDPDSGRVLIDGQDARSVTQASWRAAIGVVPQDVVLFNDTLRVNLGYGKPEADDAALIGAAEKAQLGEFIARLPEGLDTRVGERGLKLSGGEKQRVGLARAILIEPELLILDEATSSLDSETEADVQKALRAAARGRTTIAVAHRLSTVRDADEILVMEEGRIAERGTHAALITNGGTYARLWATQARSGELSGELVAG